VSDNKRLFANNNVVRNYGTVTDAEYQKAFVQLFGEEYLEYRRLWDQSSRASVPFFPVHLDFELGDVCNQACVMCPRNLSTHPNTGYALNTKAKLNPTIFKQVIDDATQHGLKSINLGAFAEPLISENLFEFVEYASAKGVIDIRIITNGLLLSQYAHKILDSKITNVFVSIDALTDDTYQSIRGRGFDVVTASVKQFIELRNAKGLRFPFVRVSFVEMKSNSSETQDFIDEWSAIADFVDIQPGEDLSLNPFFASPLSPRFTCIAPWQRMSILSTGEVLPCCNFYGRYLPVGNVNHNSIFQIWNSELIQKVRENLSANSSPVCATCQGCSLLT
jgi:radical SAM protein with 4Fe4S-binding SPASM domain